MISNISNSNQIVYDAIYSMMGSKFEFYMTGSRYFGGASPSSDYDMFVEYSNKVVHFLKELGFVFQKCDDNIAQYGDITIFGIVGLYTEHDIESRMHPLIHVQLIYPDMMYVKKTINEFFKDHPSCLNVDDTCHRLSKERVRNVWQTFISLANKVHIETKAKSC